MQIFFFIKFFTYFCNYFRYDMGLLFNFSMPKPKRFEYRPRYYDERKERLDEMKARAEAEIAAEKEGRGFNSLEKGFLSRRRESSKYRRADLQSASTWRFMRFLIILVMLLGATYIFMPEMFVAFWKIR